MADISNRKTTEKTKLNYENNHAVQYKVIHKAMSVQPSARTAILLHWRTREGSGPVVIQPIGPTTLTLTLTLTLPYPNPVGLLGRRTNGP